MELAHVQSKPPEARLHLFASHLLVVHFQSFLFACSCCQATCNSLIADFDNVHVPRGMDIAVLGVIG